MSHIRTCTVQIQNPSTDIINEALQHLARLNGMTVSSEITNYFGTTRISGIVNGIKGGKLRTGYGIIIKDGAIDVVGDDMQAISPNEMSKMVNQAYKAVVYSRAMSRNGFRPQIVQQQKQVMVVGQQ